MADDNSDAEAKLKKLGEHIWHQWENAKLPALTEKELDEVRKAVQEQWRQEELAEEKSKTTEQGSEEKNQVEEQQKKSQEQSASQSTQDNSQSEDHGHSH